MVLLVIDQSEAPLARMPTTELLETMLLETGRLEPHDPSAMPVALESTTLPMIVVPYRALMPTLFFSMRLCSKTPRPEIPVALARMTLSLTLASMESTPVWLPRTVLPRIETLPKA